MPRHLCGDAASRHLLRPPRLGRAGSCNRSFPAQVEEPPPGRPRWRFRGPRSGRCALHPTAPRAPRPAPPGLGRFKATAAPALLSSVRTRISGQLAPAGDDPVAWETTGLQSFAEIVEPLGISVSHLVTLPS